ncbi:cytochrome d ubiquinol oxidase subunit II [Planctomycetota bacterium]
MSALQVSWFLLIGILLAGYAVLDGFDLGVGFWHLFARKDQDRRVFMKAIAPVWDGNEVWLLTGGGAIFAAFPPVYACVFSGFYLALMLVLLGLILRATALEFRGQLEAPAWRRGWDVAFSLGSVIPALLFGVAVGNLVRGLPLDESGYYAGGFFDLLNPFALLVGVTSVAMFATHGALYLAMKTEGDLAKRARTWAGRAWIAYAVLFLVVSTWSLVAHQRGGVAVPILATVVAAGGIYAVRKFNASGSTGRAFVASSAAIVALLGAVGATLFPNLVPASNDSALSLTVFNASSSQNTLTVMLILALVGMPVVIGYTVYIYRTFRGTVTASDEGY